MDGQSEAQRTKITPQVSLGRVGENKSSLLTAHWVPALPGGALCIKSSRPIHEVCTFSPHFTDEEAARRVQPLAQGLTAGTLERARIPAQAAGSGAQATQPASVSPTIKQDSEHCPLSQDGGEQKIRFTGKH